MLDCGVLNFEVAGAVSLLEMTFEPIVCRTGKEEVA